MVQAMKKSKIITKNKENEFTPLNYPLVRRMHWWRMKSFNEDKGGSFNVELYLSYCEAKFRI